MDSAGFLSRIIGLFVFTFIGGRLGVDAADPLGLPADFTSVIFGLIGSLTGLILTPWITIRPVQLVRQAINQMPIETFFMTTVGLLTGLSASLLMAYPLTQLPAPFNEVVPPAVSIAGGYLGVMLFSMRAHELWEIFSGNLGSSSRSRLAMQSNRQLLLDTSVLIDGRIVEICKTGFLGGTLLIPRFVLAELQQVADSSDPLKRNRGRRGLVKLNELQRNNIVPVKITDDDIQGVREVDDKLVALALQMGAYLVTNDYPLSKVAEGQDVTVLNINLLANAVRSVYIPGESFPLRIIQEGRDPDQGVGYLEDGTMVVVSNGKKYMDRTIQIEVTRLFDGPAGRMLFAEPITD